MKRDLFRFSRKLNPICSDFLSLLLPTPTSTPWNGTPANWAEILESVVPFSFSKASFRLTFHDSRPEGETWFCMNQARLASLAALPTLCSNSLFICLSAPPDYEQLNYTDCSSSFWTSSPLPDPSDCHMPLNTKHRVKKYHGSGCLDKWINGWMDG